MACKSPQELSMRTRTVLLVVAILVVAVFAALNWSEIVRPTQLSFGLFTTDAPLGALLLAALAIVLVLFVAAGAAMRTQYMMEYRQHQKTLEAQRELAEKAEASRFIDLRSQLDAHLKAMRDRDAIAATEFDKAMVNAQREVRTQMDQMNRMISARLNELEHRLETRFERMGLPSAPLATPVRPAPETVREEAADMRAEERMRDQQVPEDERELRREERAADDRKAESGWRRWF
jgi:uncharacterized integral membrane protein